MNVDIDSQPQGIRLRYSGGLSLELELDRPFSNNTAFSMIDLANLVVEIDFGGMLHLGLHPHIRHIFEGMKLPHFHENIVTKNFKLELCHPVLPDFQLVVVPMTIIAKDIFHLARVSRRNIYGENFPSDCLRIPNIHIIFYLFNK